MAGHTNLAWARGGGDRSAHHMHTPLPGYRPIDVSSPSQMPPRHPCTNHPCYHPLPTRPHAPPQARLVSRLMPHQYAPPHTPLQQPPSSPIISCHLPPSPVMSRHLSPSLAISHHLPCRHKMRPLSPAISHNLTQSPAISHHLPCRHKMRPLSPVNLNVMSSRCQARAPKARSTAVAPPTCSLALNRLRTACGFAPRTPAVVNGIRARSAEGRVGMLHKWELHGGGVRSDLAWLGSDPAWLGSDPAWRTREAVAAEQRKVDAASGEALSELCIGAARRRIKDTGSRILAQGTGSRMLAQGTGSRILAQDMGSRASRRAGSATFSAAIVFDTWSLYSESGSWCGEVRSKIASSSMVLQVTCNDPLKLISLRWLRWIR